MHNELGRAFASIYASIPGARVVKEKKNCPAPGCRMDLVVTGLPHLAGNRLLLDHTVIHPAGRKTVGNAASIPAYAAEEAQKIKIAKYSNLLIPGDTFSALPFEVYGTTTAASVKHLRKLAEAVISERDGERATKRQVSHLLHSWRSLISVSLLEGRAKVYAEAERKREEVATGAVRCKVAQRDRWAVGHHKHRAAVAVQGQHVGLAAVRGMSRWGVVVRG